MATSQPEQDSKEKKLTNKIKQRISIIVVIIALGAAVVIAFVTTADPEVIPDPATEEAHSD
jgi:hypothetical protein